MPIIRQANGKPVYIDLPDPGRIERAFNQPSAVRPPPPAPTAPPRNPFINSQPNNTLGGGRVGIPTDSIRPGLERDFRAPSFKGNAAENIKGTTFDPEKMIKDAEKSAQRPRGASGRPLPNEVPKPPRGNPVATIPPPVGRNAPRIKIPQVSPGAGATIIPLALQYSPKTNPAAKSISNLPAVADDAIKAILGDEGAKQRLKDYQGRVGKELSEFDFNPFDFPDYPSNQDLSPTGLPPGAPTLDFPTEDYPPVNVATTINHSSQRIDYDTGSKSYVNVGSRSGSIGGVTAGGSFSSSTITVENSSFTLTYLRFIFKNAQGQQVAQSDLLLKTFNKSQNRVDSYYTGLSITTVPSGQPAQTLPNNNSEPIPGFAPQPQYFDYAPTGQFDGDDWHPSPQWTPPPGLQGSGLPQTIPAQPARKPEPADKPQKDERPRATPFVPIPAPFQPTAPQNPETGQPNQLPGPARKPSPGGYPNQGTPTPAPPPTPTITPEGNQSGSPSSVYQGQTTKGVPSKNRDELPMTANPQPTVTGTTIDFPNTPMAPTQSPNTNPNEPPEREKDRPKSPGIPNISQPSEKPTNLPNFFIPPLPRPAPPPQQSPAGTPTQPPPPPKSPTDNPCGNSPCGQKISNQQQQMANAIDALQTGQLADINADLEEIKEKLEKIRREIGLDQLPASVPKTLLKYTDPQQESIPSIIELLGWQIRQFDAISGQFPIEIQVVDNDPTKPGNQTKKYELPNISEALAELFGLTLSTAANADAAVNVGIKTAAEVVATKNATLITQDYAKANASFLGYRGNTVPRKVDYSISPFKQDNLEDFLQPGSAFIQGWREQDPETVVGFLQRIVFAAGIIKAVYFRDRKAIKRLQREIDTMLENGDTNDGNAWKIFLEELNKPDGIYNKDLNPKPKATDKKKKNGKPPNNI